MDNVITVTLKETPEGVHDYHIDFESNPTASELITTYLILKEVIENNFDKTLIYTKCAALYDRITDIEEVLRLP